MIAIARGFLYVMAAIFAAIGIAAMCSPETIAAQFDLVPSSTKGIAEVRALYGGGILGWAAIALCALRCRVLAPGLLLAMATLMGLIAMGRVASLAVDHEIMFNLATGTVETLVAMVCWVIYESGKSKENVSRKEQPSRNDER